MKLNVNYYRFLLVPAVALLLLSSCKKEALPGDTDRDVSLSARTQLNTETSSALLKAVRNATAKFNSTTQAVMAGYEADDHCVAHPDLGGMGYHWANFSMVDPVFDPLHPEALIYATGAGGKLRLVAVEYIVIDAGQPAPSFDGHPFDVGGTPVPAPHWSLHVWLYEENPAGIFVPFNPNITCP